VASDDSDEDHEFHQWRYFEQQNGSNLQMMPSYRTRCDGCKRVASRALLLHHWLHARKRIGNALVFSNAPLSVSG
jgi:hypothetical protein